MRKIKVSLFLVFILLLAACSPSNEDDISDKIKIVSSFTIITDMAEEIGGDLVHVYNLVPTGTDPHEYEPMPDDIKAASNADILLYNGLNLEGGKSGWFFKMIDSVHQDLEKAFDLNQGVEPRYLVGDQGREDEVNPHSFISPKVGIIMVENLRDILVDLDPNNKDTYENNANNYLEKLNEIDERYSKVIDSIPKERRLLVTSERAFQYMAEAYGLKEAYIWEIDTEELGTTEQIKNLVNLLNKEKPPVLFLESNVDPKPLETISKETGIPIHQENIYSDEIGIKGESVDSYLKFLEHNINIIEDGLV